MCFSLGWRIASASNPRAASLTLSITAKQVFHMSEDITRTPVTIWSEGPASPPRACMSGDVDVLEAELDRWCAQFDVDELMHLLQARGIAAGAVCSASAGITHPHLTARFTPMHHPYLGVHLYNGFP